MNFMFERVMGGSDCHCVGITGRMEVKSTDVAQQGYWVNGQKR
jgi:hypothetical protein